MKQLRYISLSLVLALTAAGCSGGGGNDNVETTSNTGTSTTGGGTNTPPVSNNDALLSGQFALLSATVGPNARAVSTGSITFDGNGNVSSGSGTTFNFSNNSVISTASTVTGGTYTVDSSRNIFGQITATGNGQTVTTSATNGRISTNHVYAAANFNDNAGNSGVFALIRPIQNSSNSGLNGTFRFSVALVGAVQGFEFGNVTFNGSGGITPGTTVTFSTGQSAQVSGGSYTLNADGSLVGSVSLNTGGSATVRGFVGQDNTIGAVITDQNQNLGLGIGSPAPTTVSSNADLDGTGSFLAVRTSPTGGFITGTAAFDGNGGIVPGNLLTLSNGATETITGGNYQINSDGTFANAVVDTSNGVVTTANFLTLGQDKTSLSGVITDNAGEQGMVILVK